MRRLKPRWLCGSLGLLLLVSGCSIAHRYPAYRGRVLEVGTDKPVQGVGVLAVYRMWLYVPIGKFERYLDYQAVVTDKEGRFTIPAKTYLNLNPLKMFDPVPSLAIYREGYGNFPGSFGAGLSKRGSIDPALVDRKFPPDKEVTFRLPKLETEAEIREHDNRFYVTSSILFEGRPFPPEGMRKELFLPPKYR